MTAPTKQALPTTEQPIGDTKQPAAPSPYGDDVEEAAALLVEQAHRDVASLDPVDRYDTLVWWQLVHQRTAELLHNVGRGEPLAELAQTHTYREIERLFAGQGTKVSDSTISKLIGAWRAWKQAAQRR